MGYFYKFKVIFFAILLIGAMQASVNGMQEINGEIDINHVCNGINNIAEFNEMDFRCCGMMILYMLDEYPRLHQHFTDSAVTRMRDLIYIPRYSESISLFDGGHLRGFNEQYSDMKEISSIDDLFVYALFSFICRLEQLQMPKCVDGEIARIKNEIKCVEIEIKKCITGYKSPEKVQKMQDELDQRKAQLNNNQQDHKAAIQKLQLLASDIGMAKSNNEALKGKHKKYTENMIALKKDHETYMQYKYEWEKGFFMASNVLFVVDGYHASERRMYEVFVDCVQVIKEIKISDINIIIALYHSFERVLDKILPDNVVKHAQGLLSKLEKNDIKQQIQKIKQQQNERKSARQNEIIQAQKQQKQQWDQLLSNHEMIFPDEQSQKQQQQK